jgi:hypothetical protein
MRTGLSVDASIGQPEPLNRTTVDQVLLHNLRGIFGLYVPVPNRIGIYDDCRPVLALVKAAGLVDAHRISQAGSLGQLLQLRM